MKLIAASICFTMLIFILTTIGCHSQNYGSNVPLRTSDGSSLYSHLREAFGGLPRSPEIQAHLDRLIAKQKSKFKFLLLTDEPGAVRANEVANGFRTQTPWSFFNLEFEILEKTTAELGCKEGEKITRLLEADRGLASREASRRNADQAMIICNIAYGGAGGDIPVFAANSTSVRTAFHEYMHTLGFADEYPYSAAEAGEYCGVSYVESRANVAHINPDSSYSSDAFARERHNDKIPWYAHITPDTPIVTSDQLGTPSENRGKFGLYKAETCSNNDPPLKLWKPGEGTTIMNSGARMDTVYSTMVFDLLADMGVPLKELPPVTSTDPAVNDRNRVIMPASLPSSESPSTGGTISR